MPCVSSPIAAGAGPTALEMVPETSQPTNKTINTLSKLSFIFFFEREGNVVTDYWIEDGLPLLGIDIEPADGLPAIEVLLEGYSHSIDAARSLHVHFSHDAEEDGLDITDDHGKTTILRFENG